MSITDWLSQFSSESSVFQTPGRLTDVPSWHGHIPFAFVLAEFLGPRLFVELGTHKGDSYCAFQQAFQSSGIDCASFAVDTWEGDEQAGYYGLEIYEDLKAYHDPLYGEFSNMLKMRFDDALSQFEDSSIDLLHIDGLHTYEAVRHDFESWLPKMSDQGVVLIHDISVQEGDFGVWKLWDELKPLYPHFGFSHSNGLGILGVGKSLPEAALNFFRMEAAEADVTRTLFSALGETLIRKTREEDLADRLDESRSYAEKLETRLEESASELRERHAYQVELETKLEEASAEISRRGEYQSDLEQRLEDGHEELLRGKIYQEEQEQRISDADTEIGRRNSYQKELEERVEVLAQEKDLREAYIDTLEEKGHEMGLTIEGLKSGRTELQEAVRHLQAVISDLEKRLHPFENSRICSGWTKFKSKMGELSGSKGGEGTK